MWSGANSISDAPIAISGNNATFAGNIIAGGAVYPATNAAASLGLSDKQWAGLDLSSSSAITWGNGDAEIVEGEVSNYSLSFKTYDGTNNSRALLLEGNNNATFTGNVGIGTTNPGAKLDIRTDTGVLIKGATSAANGKLKFLPASGGRQYNFENDSSSFKIVDASAGTTRMYFHHNGNLGIGTTSPSSMLDVLAPSSTTVPTVRFRSAGSYTFLSGGAMDPYHGLILRGTPSGATTYGVTAGDQMSFLEYGGDFRFYEKNSLSSGTLNEISRIHKTNSFFLSNVGIGTTNPGEKLEINSGNIKIQGGATSSIRGLIIAHTGQTGNQTLLVQNSTNSFGHLYTTERALRIEAGKDGGTGTGETLDFWVNGSERMMIDTTGKVGIGTTNPGAKLEVNSGATNVTSIFKSSDNQAWISIQDDDSGTYGALIGTDTDAGNDFVIANQNAQKTFVINDGKVGIGTTSPGSMLEVHKSTPYGSYGPGAGPQLNLVNTHTEGTAGFVMLSARYNNTSPAQTFYQVGGMGGGKETALANNEWGGYINFFTTSDGTAGAASGMFEHMRITADGNVGIGTTSNTTHKLIVSGGSNIASFRSEGSGQNLKKLSISTGGDRVVLDASTTADATTDFAFQTGGSQKMRIFGSTGNVGIGTTSAGAKLSVRGGDDTASSGVLEIQTAGGTNLKLGGDTTYSWIQSHASKPLYINQLGNNVILNSGGGNVGIGTVNPGTKLSVDNGQLTVNRGNTAGTIATFRGQNAAKAEIGTAQSYILSNVGIGTSTNTNTDFGSLNPRLHVINSSTSGAFNLVARFQAGGDANDTGGSILINHSNDRGLLIEGGRGGAGSTPDDDAIAHFGLVQSNGTNSRVITLKQKSATDSSYFGVGIGTTDPSGAKLVVESNTAPQILVKNPSGANAQILFEDNSGLTQNASITYDQSGQNALYITTGYNSPSDTNRIFLQPGGNTAMTLYGGDNSTGTDGSVEITKNLTVGGSITETSAKRFKENIKTLDSQTKNISKLNPVSFDWKEGGKSDIGFIAEEVKEIYPDLVSEKEGEIQGVQYTKLTAVLVKALQDQQKQIDELKKEIFILKKK
jgi:hypothetical protein